MTSRLTIFYLRTCYFKNPFLIGSAKVEVFFKLPNIFLFFAKFFFKAHTNKIIQNNYSIMSIYNPVPKHPTFIGSANVEPFSTPPNIILKSLKKIIPKIILKSTKLKPNIHYNNIEPIIIII